jgi:hypothetical protein
LLSGRPALRFVLRQQADECAGVCQLIVGAFTPAATAEYPAVTLFVFPHLYLRASQFGISLHGSSRGKGHALPWRMANAEIENIIWTDRSGLCCFIVAVPETVSHRISLVRHDGLVIRHQSVTSSADASRIAFEWYEENTGRRTAA